MLKLRSIDEDQNKCLIDVDWRVNICFIWMTIKFLTVLKDFEKF